MWRPHSTVDDHGGRKETIEGMLSTASREAGGEPLCWKRLLSPAFFHRVADAQKC